jgi:hypothetical protein
VLHGPAIVVAEPGGDIAHPGRLDATNAAGADELIEEDVRDGADQGEAAPSLANELVAGLEGDESLEAVPMQTEVPSGTKRATASLMRTSLFSGTRPS